MLPSPFSFSGGFVGRDEGRVSLPAGAGEIPHGLDDEKNVPSCVNCFHERQLDCIRPEAVTGKELHNPPEREL